MYYKLVTYRIEILVSFIQLKMLQVNQEEQQLNNCGKQISVMAVLKSPVLLANMICVTTAV